MLVEAADYSHGDIDYNISGLKAVYWNIHSFEAPGACLCLQLQTGVSD